VFQVQSDLETVNQLFRVGLVLDLHGTLGTPGGHTYPADRDPTFVSPPIHAECRKIARALRRADPTLSDWQEVAGSRSMARVEIWRRLNSPVVTIHYDDSGKTPVDDLRQQGVSLARGIFAATHPITATDRDGAALTSLSLARPLLDLRIDDDDQNLNPGASEWISALAIDLKTLDYETVWCLELGPDHGAFRALPSLALVADPESKPGDGVLGTAAGSLLLLFYPDPDYPSCYSVELLPVVQ
jgi:hypothetical protein